MTVRARIQQEAQGTFDAVEVKTVIKRWPTASAPVRVSCNDNQQYVIKGSQNGKALYNEYVCARLGNLLNAAVAWVRFADIPAGMRADPDLAHFGPGLALGSLVMPEASERGVISYTDVPANRSRFASLAVLYSWCVANDHQLLYEQIPPHTVLSNDHGYFFPGGPNWTEAALTAAQATVTRDPWFNGCGLVDADFAPYWPLLNAITDQEITDITSAPPQQWGVPQAERTALAQFLIARRPLVQAAF